MQDIFARQLLAETLLSDVRKLDKKDFSAVASLRTQYSVKVKPKISTTSIAADRYSTEEIKIMLDDLRGLGPKKWISLGADEFVRKPAKTRETELNIHKPSPEKPTKEASEYKSEYIKDRDTPNPQSSLGNQPNLIKIQPPKNFGTPGAEPSRKESGELSLLMAKKDYLREKSEVSYPAAQIHNSMTIKSNANKSVGIEKSTPKENSAIKIVEKEHYDLDDESLMSRDGGIGGVNRPYLNSRHSEHMEKFGNNNKTVQPRLLSEVHARADDGRSSSNTAFRTFGLEGKDSLSYPLHLQPNPTDLSPQDQATLKALESRKAALQASVASVKTAVNSLQPLLLQSQSQQPTANTATKPVLALPDRLQSLSDTLTSLTTITIPNKTGQLEGTRKALSEATSRRDQLREQVQQLKSEVSRAVQANDEARKLVRDGKNSLLTAGGGDAVDQGPDRAALGRFRLRNSAGPVTPSVHLADVRTQTVTPQVIRVGLTAADLPKGIASMIDLENVQRLKFLTLKKQGVAFEDERFLIALKLLKVDFGTKSSSPTASFLMRIACKQQVNYDLQIKATINNPRAVNFLSQTEFIANIRPDAYQEFRFTAQGANLDELLSISVDSEIVKANDRAREIHHLCLPVNASWFYPFRRLTQSQFKYLSEEAIEDRLVLQSEIRQLDIRVAKSSTDLIALCPTLSELELNHLSGSKPVNSPGKQFNLDSSSFNPCILFAGIDLSESITGLLQIILDNLGNFYIQIYATQSFRLECHKLLLMHLFALSDV